MRLKEKIYYFFDGYIFHILIAGFIVVLIGNFAFNKSELDYKLNGNFIGKSINVDKLEELNKDVVKVLNENDKNIRISFELDNQDGQAKLALGAVSGELDFIMLEKESYIKLKEKGFFLDIKELMDNKELPYLDNSALVISESERIKSLDYNSKNKVMSVISTSKNLENIKAFIDYIYQ